MRAAYRLSVNEYNGVQSVQLMVEHLQNVQQIRLERLEHVFKVSTATFISSGV